MPNGHINHTADHVRLRGTREGIDLVLPAHLSTDELIEQVRREIGASQQYLQRSKVFVRLDERTLHRDEVERLADVLRERSIDVQSFTVTRPDQRALLRTWGIDAVEMDVRASAPGAAPQDKHAYHDERTALYVKRTLRSGAAVHSNGDVVLLGDVNPGAEITAVGDIIVWGVLRGTVHAGATGDDSARICALRLQPTQIRIGSIVARPPDGKQSAMEGPQSAYIQDAIIVVEPWRGVERRGRSS